MPGGIRQVENFQAALEAGGKKKAHGSMRISRRLCEPRTGQKQTRKNSQQRKHPLPLPPSSTSKQIPSHGKKKIHQKGRRRPGHPHSPPERNAEQPGEGESQQQHPPISDEVSKQGQQHVANCKKYANS